MAVTVTDIVRGTIGHRRMALVRVTFDNSYPTGGEPFTPGQVGMSDFDAVFVEGGARAVRYDHTNKKLLAYHGDYPAIGAGALTEVPDATDLSAFDAKLLCIGA